MRDALEANARRAIRESIGDGEQKCWEVEVGTDVFFNADKSSFLTPSFLVRRCLPRGADTTAADVVLVGEVFSGSDTFRYRDWKADCYAEAGIPWYWQVELDSAASWDISIVWAYERVVIPSEGLAVKPLRPAAYVAVGEWEPRDIGIDLPKPFDLHISWDELAF